MNILEATGAAHNVTYVNGWLTVSNRVGNRKSVERYRADNVSNIDYRAASRIIQGHLRLHMNDGRRVSIIFRHNANEAFRSIHDALVGLDVAA